MATYIIEHLEPKLFEWCFIEYKNISKIVKKKNLWFTNIKSKKEAKKLRKYGKVIKNSVVKLNLKNSCILDMDTKKTLSPKEAKKFAYFIFGGILGDYPRKKRTKKELTSKIKNAEARNIGKKQFSTDNAVYITKKINSGTSLSKIKLKNNIEIKINKIESTINKIESTILPYCYPIINNKPKISKELIAYLKRK